MRYVYLLVLVCLACSSTVTAGGADAVAGAAGNETGTAGSTTVTTGGAGGESSTGSGSAPSNGGASGSVNAGGSGGAPVSCTAPLPTSLTWSHPDTWQHCGVSCLTYQCSNDPCWSAQFTWDESSILFDEAYSQVSVSVSVHSSGELGMLVNGQSCALQVSDFTAKISFKVVKVSNGYEITSVSDNNLLQYGYSRVLLGTCSSTYAGDWSWITSDLEVLWLSSLSRVILPCVQ